MNLTEPKNAAEVQKTIEDRVAAVAASPATEETTTVMWRGQLKHLPVITMNIDLLSYNPDTHRVRAQRSLDAAKEEELKANPYGPTAQAYLHDLLKGDPADPTRVDPSFDNLKEDLKQYSQKDPGIITRAGVLINGNTRRAALKELGKQEMRVGVLPPDAGHDDILAIEFSLQLHRDHRRDYSFMNFLLAVDERVLSGRPAVEIQREFRIKARSFDRAQWILRFVNDAINRSRTKDANGTVFSMRLVDFEQHQGKLEELYRAYTALKPTSPDEADALREQRLLAIVFNRSKTDLRLIGPDFSRKYMKALLAVRQEPEETGVQIPGTTIIAGGQSSEVVTLSKLATDALKARAVMQDATSATPEQVTQATKTHTGIADALELAIRQANRQERETKVQLAPVDRLGDARDDLELALSAVAAARQTQSFNPDDIDEVLTEISENLYRLAQLVARSGDGDGDGLSWLRSVAQSQAK